MANVRKLRVITGRLKNRRFRAPPGLTTRPSLEKTRGILFDTLEARIDLTYFQVVDLFAGSGALGLEAYSRGAEPLWFCETGKAFPCLKENLQTLLPRDSFSLLRFNGLDWLKQLPPADKPWLFLLDPPYQQGLGQKALDSLSLQADSLVGSWVVLEGGRDCPPKPSPNLELQTMKEIGKSRLDFFEILP